MFVSDVSFSLVHYLFFFLFHLQVAQIAFWDRKREEKDKWDVLITVCGANVF